VGELDLEVDTSNAANTETRAGSGSKLDGREGEVYFSSPSQAV
jgi:hypothetical protein